MVLREQPRFSGLAEIKPVTGQSPPPADTRIRPIRPIGPIREDRQPPNAKCCHTKATAVSDGGTRAASDRLFDLAEIKPVMGQSPLPADTRIRPIRPIGPIREDR
jgi:hypothetical protein